MGTSTYIVAIYMEKSLLQTRGVQCRSCKPASSLTHWMIGHTFQAVSPPLELPTHHHFQNPIDFRKQ